MEAQKKRHRGTRIKGKRANIQATKEEEKSVTRLRNKEVGKRHKISGNEFK